MHLMVYNWLKLWYNSTIKWKRKETNHEITKIKSCRYD